MIRAALALSLVACGPPSTSASRVLDPDRVEPPASVAAVSPPEQTSDRDGDLILDRCDRCPDEPEIYQTFDDDDGCPETRATLFIEESIHPAQASVFFDQGASELDERWLIWREGIVQVVAGRGALEVATVGFAHPSEPDPDRLAQARAEALCRRAVAERPGLRCTPHAGPTRDDPSSSPENTRRALVIEVTIPPRQWYQEPYVIAEWDGQWFREAPRRLRDRPEGPPRCPDEVMARYR